MDTSNIKSAKYVDTVQLDGTKKLKEFVRVVMKEGDDLFVPTDEANMNYVTLMQMVADGDLTIADAD